METKSSYVVVGAFVLTFIAALFVFVVWLAKVQFDETATLYRIFFTGSVTGLQEGSPVRYSGVPIGTVTDIRINPVNVEQVQVTIEVPADTPIKADSIASLELQGITGGAYIQITGGTQSSPLLRSTSDDVPVIASQPSSLETVFDATPQLLENLIILSDSLAGFLTVENQAAVARILVNAETLSASAAASARDLALTMDEVRTTLAEFRQLAADLRTTSQTVASGADRALDQAEQTLATFDTAAGTFTNELQVTSRSLQELIGTLDGASVQLAAILEENREPIRDFTGSGLYEISLLIAELRELANSLSRVTTRIERDPADFLFGTRRGGVELE